MERSAAFDCAASALSAYERIHLKNLNLHFRIGSPGRVSLRPAFLLLPIHAELKSEIHLCLCALCFGAIDCLLGANGATLCFCAQCGCAFVC